MKYFTINELTHSDTAIKKGIDNAPGVDVINNLIILINNLLDPIREMWGSGVLVTSGYRCEELNRAVGGVSNSAHLTGYAADLYPVNGEIEMFFAYVVNWTITEKINFDQIIFEKNAKGSLWVHVGLYGPNMSQRKQHINLVEK